MTATVDRRLDELLEPFSGPLADGLYDEAVTERQHALQCADLAVAASAPEALVAAALLHDIGHLLAGDLVGLDADLDGDARHEDVGARHLRRWFGPAVTAPVALHVAAKRYLCATDDSYASALSPSSTRSLAVQGGPMSGAEVRSFEALTSWRDAVTLRRWDDEAKVAGRPTSSLDDVRPLLGRLLTPS